MKAIIIKSIFKLEIFSAIILTSFLCVFSQTVEKTEPNLARQYQKLGSGGKPVYISTDLAFEEVRFFFSDALEQIEKENLSKNLETGLTDALSKTAADLKAEKDGATREILTSNYAYLLTALRLLLPESDAKLKAENARAAEFLISPDLRNIKNEIDLIFAAKELAESPLLGYTEDYTQYAPRGRYTKSAEQIRYFRTVVWLGRMGFYTEPNSGNGIDEKKADFLTARAATLLKIIGAQNAFTDYDKTMTALVGGSDDLTINESIALIEKAAGKKIADTSFQEILSNVPKIRRIIKSEARPPKILSTVAEAGKPAPVAVRLIGQRFTPDSYVFQNTTFAKVLDYTGKAEPFTLSITADGRKVRGVPRLFDLLDALGIKSAVSEIEKSGDHLYESYESQRALMRREMPVLLKEKNFTNAYLSAIKETATVSATRTTEDFTNRLHLNSAAGAYTLLRHELAAYAKQSYTNVGRGLTAKQETPRKAAPPTFVENAPQVFLNLKTAVEIIIAMPDVKAVAEHGRKLAAALQLLSEAAGKSPLPKPKAESLWKTVDEWALTANQSAVVADVHTDLNSRQVLQIGVGFPQIVEIKIGTQTAAAAVFSLYEFRQPIAERLTDERWRVILSQPDQSAYRLFSLKASITE